MSITLGRAFIIDCEPEIHDSMDDRPSHSARMLSIARSCGLVTDPPKNTHSVWSDVRARSTTLGNFLDKVESLAQGRRVLMVRIVL